MWARRLGVPHLWPSRVKVFVLGVISSFGILTIFQYLHQANVEYLDLLNPISKQIVCRAPLEECAMVEDPVRCTVLYDDNYIWRGLNLTRTCPEFGVEGVTTRGEARTCRNPSIPLEFVVGEFGSLRTVKGVNPFKLWSILFLILTSLSGFSIVIHDLALLEEGLRPSILSLPNMKYATPCLWEWMAGLQCRRRMRFLRRRYRWFWGLLVPVWTFAQVFAFIILLYPVAFSVFLLAPIRMSRIMVFLSSILCIVWSIIFVIETAVNAQPYAVLWGVATESGNNCICLCEFFLSRSVILRVCVLAATIILHSVNLTLRALKGLRRAQWANMFSVLYSVPIEAFPVVWSRPDGDPIRHREEGEAIQSEPAFDPFCLMDEQPESAWTRGSILPEAWTEHQALVWEPYSGTLDTEIGCCGFPQPLHSVWRDGVEDEEMSDSQPGSADEKQQGPNEEDDETAKTAGKKPVGCSHLPRVKALSGNFDDQASYAERIRTPKNWDFLKAVVDRFGGKYESTTPRVSPSTIGVPHGRLPTLSTPTASPAFVADFDGHNLRHLIPEPTASAVAPTRSLPRKLESVVTLARNPPAQSTAASALQNSSGENTPTRVSLSAPVSRVPSDLSN